MLKLEINNKHPLDEQIVFEESEHLYFLRGKQVGTSVTTLIHKFQPPFESDKIAENISLNKCSRESREKYKNMTKEMIIEKWKIEGVKSSSLGTEMHRDIELYFNDEENKENNSLEYSYFKNFLATPHMDNLVPFRTEWTVYDEELDIAGQIDMLFFDTSTNTYVIYDWKRSKEISFTQKFRNNKYLKAPLDHLENCNFNTYSLQLNIYRYILHKNYSMKVSRMHLLVLHPNHESYIKVDVEPLDDEIQSLVEFRKNEMNEKKELFAI